VIISQTGKITEDFHTLGHPAIPLYLLDGPAPTIFDAGLALLADLYVREIKKVLGARQPAFCFLTHAHFDHCGSIAVLKKYFPRMQVVASRRSADILNNPKAVQLIDQLNRSARQMVADLGLEHSNEGGFEPFAIDRHISDGETIQLASDLHIRAIETPGHTRDCISYLVEEKKILLSSEALGQEHPKGVVVTDCLSDYDAYRTSLLTLAGLGADVICPGHFFVYTGKDAIRYTDRAVAACQQFRTLVETIYREEKGDRRQIMQRIKAIEYDGYTGPRQPEAAYLLNLEARIKAVLHTRSQENNIQ
jgi:glyoxylase-like metal-dependent hydrolase (beta-lactamase superfamily II)